MSKLNNALLKYIRPIFDNLISKGKEVDRLDCIDKFYNSLDSKENAEPLSIDIYKAISFIKTNPKCTLTDMISNNINVTACYNTLRSIEPDDSLDENEESEKYEAFRNGCISWEFEEEGDRFAELLEIASYNKEIDSENVTINDLIKIIESDEAKYGYQPEDEDEPEEDVDEEGDSEDEGPVDPEELAKKIEEFRRYGCNVLVFS